MPQYNTMCVETTTHLHLLLLKIGESLTKVADAQLQYNHRPTTSLYGSGLANSCSSALCPQTQDKDTCYSLISKKGGHDLDAYLGLMHTGVSGSAQGQLQS